MIRHPPAEILYQEPDNLVARVKNVDANSVHLVPTLASRVLERQLDIGKRLLEFF